MRVQELEHLAALVDDDDAPPRSRGLELGRGARLPELEEPDPVLGGEALEAHVRGQQGSTPETIAAACYMGRYAVDAEEIFVRYFSAALSAGRPRGPRPGAGDRREPRGNPAICRAPRRSRRALRGERRRPLRRRPRARSHGRQRPPPERGADARPPRRLGPRRRRRARPRARCSTSWCMAPRTSARASWSLTAPRGACGALSGRASCTCGRARARAT